jgi:hypothetical protein
MEPLSAEAVVTSLESYFRFLRNTGRMAARSASPAELVKEAKRSAPRMKAAAEDRAHWSSGKVLQDFGAQRGIAMDVAPDLETLQDRLNEVTNVWNALPIHERQRLMPHPGDRDDESGRDRALAAYDIDDEVTALLLGFRYELPSGELPPTAETAPFVERAGLLDRVAAMSEWIAPHVEVTATNICGPSTHIQPMRNSASIDAWLRRKRPTSLGAQRGCPVKPCQRRRPLEPPQATRAFDDARARCSNAYVPGGPGVIHNAGVSVHSMTTP